MPPVGVSANTGGDGSERIGVVDELEPLAPTAALFDISVGVDCFQGGILPPRRYSQDCKRQKYKITRAEINDVTQIQAWESQLRERQTYSKVVDRYRTLLNQALATHNALRSGSVTRARRSSRTHYVG